jgi:hypothetical protein
MSLSGKEGKAYQLNIWKFRICFQINKLAGKFLSIFSNEFIYTTEPEFKKSCIVFELSLKFIYKSIYVKGGSSFLWRARSF